MRPDARHWYNSANVFHEIWKELELEAARQKKASKNVEI